MGGIAADSVWPERLTARTRFDSIASRFTDAAFIHDEARNRLLERLDFLRIDPAVVVDLGCGTGEGARLLGARFPAARVVAVDASGPMLVEAGRAGAAATRVQADAEQLPFRDRSVDLLFANLLLPWCRPDRLTAELARVLAADGLLLISTVGPDTLAELRRAWREVDEGIHVHGFFDMHDLGELLARAGLAEPVMDVDRMTVTYGSTAALFADLKACGGRNSARGRSHSLTSRARWSRFESAVERQRRDGRIAVGVELIFAQAWGRGRDAGGPAGGGEAGEISVPVDRIGRR